MYLPQFKVQIQLNQSLTQYSIKHTRLYNQVSLSLLLLVQIQLNQSLTQYSIKHTRLYNQVSLSLLLLVQITNLVVQSCMFDTVLG
jgi:hypothetical protein